MSVCSVAGCRRRSAPGSKIRFFRVPQGTHPFQVNRRRLWEQALTQANGGSAELLKSKPRVCGAHFISGEASLDFDDPDFVPSVFTCTKKPQRRKLGGKKLTRNEKRRRHTVNTEEQTSPSDGPSLNLESSNLLETENEVSKEEEGTPSELEEQKMSTNEVETEATTKGIPAVTTPSPEGSSAPVKLPAGVSELFKKKPIVLIRRVLTPAGDFLCDSCDQTFSGASLLVEHKRLLHEEQQSFICEICGGSFTSQEEFTEHQANHPKPGFPCNMCHRSFPSVQHLKRHKLLHVRDGRKCLQCGVLFCRRHNHVAFRPQTASVVPSEEDSSSGESEELSGDAIAVEDVPKEAELCKTEPIEVELCDLGPCKVELLEAGLCEVEPCKVELLDAELCEVEPCKVEPLEVGLCEVEPCKVELLEASETAGGGSGGVQSSQILIPLLTSQFLTIVSNPQDPGVLPQTPDTSSHIKILPKVSTPLLLASPPMPPPAPPPPTPSTNSDSSVQAEKIEPQPSTVKPEENSKFTDLPPSLRMFSPHLLTSALLEVKRDFDYIFSKPRRPNTVTIVEKEESKPVKISLPTVCVKPRPRQRVAYDLEIEL